MDVEEWAMDAADGRVAKAFGGDLPFDWDDSTRTEDAGDELAGGSLYRDLSEALPAPDAEPKAPGGLLVPTRHRAAVLPKRP